MAAAAPAADSGFTLRVNGRERVVVAAAKTPLLAVLRESLGLVGTRFGCGTNQCGACHVLLDGRSVAACDTPLWAAVGHEVTTVEGLPERLRQAFVAEQAGQCGYCSSGLLIAAAALLARTPQPSDSQVREALDGHLCRCGAHNRIVRAVQRAGGAAATHAPGTAPNRDLPEDIAFTAANRVGTEVTVEADRCGGTENSPAADGRMGTEVTFVPDGRVSTEVTFAADGRVRVRTGKVEIGQGLHTALAQIVADELGVGVELVDMLPVDTDHSPDQGVTSGSLSIQDAGAALRRACAELRRARAGLRPGAARPVAVAALVGQSLPRADLADKFAGRPRFIHDLVLPGLLHGRVLHPPQAEAQVLHSDEAALRGLPGVQLVHRDGRLFGVVADSAAAADAAFEQLTHAVHWQAATAPPDDAAAALRQAPATTRMVVERGAAVAPALRHRARYSKPWIAHASIATSCALARWSGGRLEVWSHSQGIFNLRRDLALAFGVDAGAVRVVHVEGAGCYGHNGADDVAFDAAWLARQVPGRPLRVLWSRADELSHAPFGPAMTVEIEAGLDGDGRIAQWQHAVWSPGHSRRPGRSSTPALLGSWQVADAAAVPASIDMPLASGGGAERNAIPGYDIAAVRVLCHSVQSTRRSSALRALGAFANVFAAESFVDELALASGQDRLAFRRRHLQHDARALAVLDATAARAGWATRQRSDGIGQGLAVARYKGTGAWCAVVAEVEAGATLRVRRLTIAVDVGLAVNPDGVIAQIEGGAIQATSWALLESAAPAHASWADYPILRFSQVPPVDVLVLPSTAPSLGAGEAAIGPTAAAIANALFDALGVRVRDLPLTPERIVSAMQD